MLPTVGVVLPTHNRPKLLRQALESVLAQEYEGEVRAVVVYDRAESDQSLALDRRRASTAGDGGVGLAVGGARRGVATGERQRAQAVAGAQRRPRRRAAHHGGDQG